MRLQARPSTATKQFSLIVFNSNVYCARTYYLLSMSIYINIMLSNGAAGKKSCYLTWLFLNVATQTTDNIWCASSARLCPVCCGRKCGRGNPIQLIVPCAFCCATVRHNCALIIIMLTIEITQNIASHKGGPLKGHSIADSVNQAVNQSVNQLGHSIKGSVVLNCQITADMLSGCK